MKKGLVIFIIVLIVVVLLGIVLMSLFKSEESVKSKDSGELELGPPVGVDARGGVGGVTVKLSCIDGDKGKNENVSGMVNMTNKTGKFSYQDYCSGSSVVEYFCSNPNQLNSTKIECTGGCENGACKLSPLVSLSLCVDSDKGKNAAVFGIVNVTNKTGKFSYPDLCDSFTDLREYFCSGNMSNSTIIKCPKKCSARACI